MVQPAIALPILNGGYSSRDASYPSSKFSDAEVAYVKSVWHWWYVADLTFGLGTVYFLVGGISALALLYFLSTGLARITSTPAGSRLTALGRWPSAKQFRIRRWYTPSITVLAVLGVMTIFFLLMTFAPQPYWWPDTKFGHSPPIATRTGWLSTACLPFIILFATKVNYVTMLTGISHERLHIAHSWLSWISLVLSLVHTVPFCMVGLSGWLTSTSPYGWTGWPPLAAQFWLTFASWKPIRDRFGGYEVFKSLHFFFAVFYILWLFLHVSWRLTSWNYIYATVALLLSAVILRFTRAFWVSRRGLKAQLTDHNTDWLALSVPTKASWHPGAHYFVRFLSSGVHALTSHPFSVTNAPNGTATFLFRARSGITARLRSRAKVNDIKVMLDGPYGGLNALAMARFEDASCILLLAGGSGISPTLSILDWLLTLPGGRQITLVWSIRHLADDMRSPVLARLDEAQARGVDVRIHITGGAGLVAALAASPGGDTKKTPQLVSGDAFQRGAGDKLEMMPLRGEGDEAAKAEVLADRPNLAAIVKQAFQTDAVLAVFACGPHSFNYDARNAVAAGQLAIAKGTSPVTSAWLECEEFSY